MAAVMTNDADLAEPIRVVEHDLTLPVTLVHPTRWPARELRKVSPSNMMRLSVSTVRQSELISASTNPRSSCTFCLVTALEGTSRQREEREWPGVLFE